jgi:hypothetical protein
MPSNINEFTATVNAWAAKHQSGQSMDVIMRKLTLDGLLGVTNYTPVDTGYARFNWQVSMGAPVEKTVGTPESEYPELQSERVGRGAVVHKVPGRGTVPKWGVIYIANNVEYIEYLNNGTPRMPAQLMIERTEADLLAELAKPTGHK